MAVEDPRTPLVFDAALNEYHFKCQPGDVFILRFCPWCGGKLPESKRHELFEDTNPDEVTEARRLIAGCKTLDAIVTALGEPDDREGQMGVTRPDGTSARSIRSLNYRTRWRTIELRAYEFDDGRIETFISPQSKQR